MRRTTTTTTIISALLLMFTALAACSSDNKKANESSYLQSMEKEEPHGISQDAYITNNGELGVSLLGHASIVFKYKGKVIHVDPYSKVADYSTQPKADLILLTHEHSDHLDTTAINQIKKSDTHFITSKVVNGLLGEGEVLNNGDITSFDSISIEAVPAYNIEHKTPEGVFYHPKGRGNGYVLTFGDKKVYVAGDTENIPEMTKLSDIYIAFLPKNLPYTMTDDMFVDAAKKVKPIYLYPYHFADFNDKDMEKALEGTNIKILVRPMSSK